MGNIKAKGLTRGKQDVGRLEAFVQPQLGIKRQFLVLTSFCLHTPKRSYYMTTCLRLRQNWSCDCCPFSQQKCPQEINTLNMHRIEVQALR